MVYRDRYENCDFSNYDNMTNEELDEILRTHFLLEDGNNDMAMIEHILDVLTERE